MLRLALGNLFLLLDCLAQAEYRGKYLVLWKLHMPRFADAQGKLDSFLTKYGESMDWLEGWRREEGIGRKKGEGYGQNVK